LRVPSQRPGNEAAADAGIAGSGEFPLEPFGIAITAADQAEPARFAHRGRELAARRIGHRRGDDRMLDTELLRQPRPHASLRGFMMGSGSLAQGQSAAKSAFALNYPRLSAYICG